MLKSLIFLIFSLRNQIAFQLLVCIIIALMPLYPWAPLLISIFIILIYFSIFLLWEESLGSSSSPVEELVNDGLHDVDGWKHSPFVQYWHNSLCSLAANKCPSRCRKRYSTLLFFFSGYESIGGKFWISILNWPYMYISCASPHWLDFQDFSLQLCFDCEMNVKLLYLDCQCMNTGAIFEHLFLQSLT